MPSPHRTIVQVLHHKSTAVRTGEQFLLALAARLRDAGWRTVHVAEGEPCDEFRRRLSQLDIPYIAARFPLTVPNARILGRQLRPFNPDLLHTTFISPFLPALRVLKSTSGAPRLLINDFSSGTSSSKRGLRRLLAKARGHLATRHVDRIIALSEFVRRRDVQDVCLPPDKVHVVLHGIELDRFSNPRRPQAGPVSIAYAGQLIPEKGVLCLLKAVAALPRDGSIPAIHLRIAGAGPQEAELKTFCHSHHLDCVEFLGQINWIPRLFAEADIVVIPSEWGEAFGLVVVEAMACGACVIGSDAGGIPEILGPNSTAGLIFRKADPTDLTQKLLTLLTNPPLRQQMSSAACSRAHALFSMPHMIDQYVHHITQLTQP